MRRTDALGAGETPSHDSPERRRDDRRLRESEARTRAILETALDAIITIDGDGRVVEFNPAAERMFGYSRDAVMGQEMASLIVPPALRTQHRDGLARYLATSDGPLIGRRVETTAMRSDGTIFPVELAIVRIPLDGPPLFTGHLRDVTERQHAEDERRRLLDLEQQARAEAVAWAAEQEAVFEAISDGAFICDRDGVVLRTNAAFRRLVALQSQESYTTLSARNRARLMNLRDEEGQPLRDEQWPVSRILRGEVLTGENAADVLVRRLDGRDVLLNIGGAPLRDGEGRVRGGVCICRDVTERRGIERRTHAALDALLAMAEALVQPAGAGGEGAVGRRLAELTRDVLGCRRVSITASDTHTGLQRPVAVVGLAPDQERFWLEQIARWRLDGFDAALDARLRAGEMVLLDLRDTRYTSPNPYGAGVVLIAALLVADRAVGFLALDYGGADHDYSAHDLALAGAAARLAALVIERERLTREREEARSNEMALRDANRRMDEFLGIAGHEMRTPLTSIAGNIQLAQRRLQFLSQEGMPDALVGELAMVRQRLDRGDRQLRRLNRLVADLLDVSRIHAGRLEIRLERCDLASLVREVVQEQRQLAQARTIRLVDPAQEPVVVYADIDRITQVVTNYLSNALKYSPAERPVEVGLRVDGRVARVWVRDEGPGLPPAEQEKVWDRFYRAAGIEHQHGSSVGLGLGLHINRTIVERHHGQVGVQSVPGAGATFWFTLPLAPA